MQQPSGERADSGASGPRGWTLGRLSGAGAPSSPAGDELAAPWAGAPGPEDDPDATLAFTGPDLTSARGDNATSSAGGAWGETTLRVGPRTAAGFSYLFWWVSGLVVYFNERENKYVRFHAAQAILLTSALTIFGVLAYLVTSLLFDLSASTRQPAFHHLGVGLGALAAFLILILWLAPMIGAWSGEYLRLPVIGSYAERYAALPSYRLDD